MTHLNKLYYLLTLIFISSPLVLSADTNSTVSLLTPKDHDVKFIVESSLSTSTWDSGVSKISGSDVEIFDYDTEGLKLYAIKGKVNIFDSDVFVIEKYGTFASRKEQKELEKQREYNQDSAIEGVNISLRAFLLLKYFYLYSYDFLDAVEYQYDYYNFYAKVTNNIDVVYWYGETNQGHFDVPLPTGSTSEFTTEFNEHRLYLLELKKYFDRFFIDSLRVGWFSTYWVKESFVGVTANNGATPVMQDVLLESRGITVEAGHTIKKMNLDLKLRYNHGFDNYVVVSNGYYEPNYYSYDIIADYHYDIYQSQNYNIFTKVNLTYGDRWFKNYEYNLDSESLFAIAVSLGVVF